MVLTSYGDRGHLLLTQRLVADLRGRADRAAAEMTTGTRQDLRAPASADLGHLLSLRRDQRLLDSYRLATTEAATRAEAVQAALQTIADTAPSVASNLTLTATAAQPAQMATAAGAARAAFAAAVSTLNSSAGGVSLFSGVLSDRPALIDGEAMLAALGAATAGETTISGLADAVAAWFGPGGGYESTAFRGDPTPTASRIAEGESLSLPVTALDPAIRATLGGLALAALSGQLAANPAAQAATLTRAGEQLHSSQSALIELQADLGLAQARIDARAVEAAARQTSLALAEQKLTGVDPFAAATAFEEAATRLDTVFAVTARMSKLSLLEHIR